MFIFICLYVHVRISVDLCVSHHYQVIEEEHLPLMGSLFLRFIYISDLIESTAAHQPTVRNWQYLRKKERDQKSREFNSKGTASISTGNEKGDFWCCMGWRKKLIFHMEVQCFTALSCEVWNYSTKLMSSFSLKFSGFFFLTFKPVFINRFT